MIDKFAHKQLQKKKRFTRVPFSVARVFANTDILATVHNSTIASCNLDPKVLPGKQATEYVSENMAQVSIPFVSQCFCDCSGLEMIAIL